jgi:hypothetical protein
MNDEVATATIAPAVAIVTTMVGITLWPFAVAFVFALCALVYQEAMIAQKAFANVIVATLLGGAIAQISAVPALLITIKYMPSLTSWAMTAEIPMTALIAILIGLAAHKVVPRCLELIGKLGGSQ